MMLTMLHGGMSFGVTFCQLCPSSACQLDQAVVGARPQQALRERRFCERENGVVVFDAGDVERNRPAGGLLLASCRCA